MPKKAKPNSINNNERQFNIYYRKLPHWRLTGAVYFITWHMYKTQPALTSDECDHVYAALKHFDNKRYKLLSFVVMDDHVHVLVRPLDGNKLHEIVHSWKSYTAHIIQRNYMRTERIWQPEYFDRIIRNEKELLEKAQYILNNPLKRWPCRNGYAWVWSEGMHNIE